MNPDFVVRSDAVVRILDYVTNSLPPGYQPWFAPYGSQVRNELRDVLMIISAPWWGR